MVKVHEGNRWRILEGHVVESLRSMPTGSAHCVVTSPPYWALRSYKTTHQTWGGQERCEHDFTPPFVKRGTTGGVKSDRVQVKDTENFQIVPDSTYSFCRTCGAWRGEYGSEPEFDCLAWARGEEPRGGCYTCHTVMILREIRRVLRDDGAVVWNVGDSYLGGGGIAGVPDDWDAISTKDRSKYVQENDPKRDARKLGFGKKNLALVPYRVALAAQDDGWTIRDVAVWAKGASGAKRFGAVMPESVTDRLTKAWEPMLLLTKGPDYYFDMEAVREAFVDERMANPGSDTNNWKYATTQTGGPTDILNFNADGAVKGGQPRNVLHFPIEPLRDAHFAPFPTSLPTFWVKALTPERGVCGKCGAPWERVVEKRAQGNGDALRGKGEALDADGTHHGQNSRRGVPGSTFNNNPRLWGGTGRSDLEKMRGEDGHLHWGDNHSSKNPDKWSPKFETLDWRPTCSCAAEVVSATVLDPFAGSGTTLMAAMLLSRQAVGCELNPDYVGIAKKRITEKVPGADSHFVGDIV